jgi:hypothetical protein
MVAILVGPVIGLFALPSVEGLPLLVLVTALVSSMLGAGAITQSFLSDAIPADMRGTGLGAVRTTASTTGAMGPVVFGVMADSGYFDEGYLVLSGIMVTVILLTIKMPTTSPDDHR